MFWRKAFHIVVISILFVGGIHMPSAAMENNILTKTLLGSQVSDTLDATILTIDVDDIDDNNPNGGCTFREAIDVVNAGLGPGSVVNGCTVIENGTGLPITYEINLPSFTYTLSGVGGEDYNVSGDLDIIASVTIKGTGADSTVIDGGEVDRVIHLPLSDLDITVNISNISVQNGRLIDYSAGAGIHNNGNTLTINDCIISNNKNFPVYGYNAGGIYNKNGTLTINNSTFSSNFTEEGLGNGIYSLNSTLTISNSVFSNNGPSGLSTIEIHGGSANISNSTIANNDGRGIGTNYATLNMMNSTITGNSDVALYLSNSTNNIANSTISDNFTNDNGGGFHVTGGTTNLTNVTIFNNIADNDNNGSGNGGGIYNPYGTFNIKNTILAGNNDKSGGGPDCYGSFASLGYNLIGVNSGCVASFPGGIPNSNNDFVGTEGLPLNPFLGGQMGNPPYYILQLGSLAIDKIPDENCTFVSSGTNPLFTNGASVFTDQPGTNRDSTCDIGAYEVPQVGIQVLDGISDIPDDTGSVDFGWTTVGNPITKQFTVKNIGKTSTLLLSELTVPAGFSIVENFGSTVVSVGGQTDFKIKLDAISAITSSGQISFTNNVVNRNPFNFYVNGTVSQTSEIYLPLVLGE